jgi:hypothetical protein
LANINSRNVNEAEELLYRSFKNLITFGKHILSGGKPGGGDFLKTQPTAIFHKEIGHSMMARSTKPLAFILPRRSAKSTFSKAKILHSFCFAKKAKEFGFTNREHTFFFGWCADNKKKSEKNVAYVQLHLEHNPMIKYYFGNLKGKTWNMEDIETNQGDKLISTSNLTSLRGDTQATVFEGALRYSGVFLDDVENEKNTLTENSRGRIADQILNNIMPGIEKVDLDKYESWFYPRMFLSGTPVHFDSFYQKLIDQWRAKVLEYGGSDPLAWTSDPEELRIRKAAAKDFEWKVICYKSTQPELPGGVLWHEHNSRKLLDEEMRRMEINDLRGRMGYYQEYELEVTRDEDAIIGRKSIKYWKGYFEYDSHTKMKYLYVDGERKIVNTFLGCDPATDIDKKTSDFSVILVICMDIEQNIYVVPYERHRGIPTTGLRGPDKKIIGKKGVVDHIVELYKKYQCNSGKVEDVAMNRSIFPALHQYKMDTGDWDVHVSGEPVSTIVSKKDKLYTSLGPRFAYGHIYYMENMFALIDETIKFGPKQSHDDCLDALYYALKGAYPPSLTDNINNTQTKEVPTSRDWQT